MSVISTPISVLQKAFPGIPVREAEELAAAGNRSLLPAPSGVMPGK